MLKLKLQGDVFYPHTKHENTGCRDPSDNHTATCPPNKGESGCFRTRWPDGALKNKKAGTHIYHTRLTQKNTEHKRRTRAHNKNSNGIAGI
jgi:hypothetical protein